MGTNGTKKTDKDQALNAQAERPLVKTTKPLGIGIPGRRRTALFISIYKTI